MDVLAYLCYLLSFYRDAIREMDRVVGKTFTSVNIVGGRSRNEVLNRLAAETTGLPVMLVRSAIDRWRAFCYHKARFPGCSRNGAD